MSNRRRLSRTVLYMIALHPIILSRRLEIWCAAFLIVLGFPHHSLAAIATSTNAPSDYERLIQRYSKEPRARDFGNGVEPVKLILRTFGPNETSQNVYTVSREGRAERVHLSIIGSKGGGGTSPVMPASDLTRLDELIARLLKKYPPPPAADLPPFDRRLVIQVPERTGFSFAVFNLAEAPDLVLEIIRITRSGIRTWVPTFAPTATVTAHRYGTGVFGLLPGGRLIVSAASSGPFTFWNVESRQLVKEIPAPFGKTRLSFNPDRSVALIEDMLGVHLVDTKTWQRLRTLSEPVEGQYHPSLSSPEFTADGNFLLLRRSKGTLRIFETTTWNRRLSLPGIPEGAHAYVPDRKGRRGIYMPNDATIALWDGAAQREYATLDDDAKLNLVAFSHDDSLVAAATQKSSSGNYGIVGRIRIWKTSTGELVHELRPFEQGFGESVEGLLWSSDGNQVLAAARHHRFYTSRSIGVWSVRSGRHVGDFQGLPTTVSGFAVVPDESQLVAGCWDGKIRFWNFAAGMKEIRAYEGSLGKFNLGGR